MSLFRYTNDEYDNMYIRYPDGVVQYFISHLHQEGFNRFFNYVNRDGMIYTVKDVRRMIRLLFQYFYIHVRNAEINEIFCRDVNNNISSSNEIVLQFFQSEKMRK
jgi:hypothetical protein